MSSIEEAKRVLKVEADALMSLRGRVGVEFDQAVEAIMACRGRVVVSGMGKSGLVGRKVAATLASLGTPALFLHPAEGVHGDIGMLARGDCVLAISRSGETAEMLALLPSIKRLGLGLISMTGVCASTLAKESTVVLDVSVDEEACPMDLAPTASTTAALALGDALAIAVFQRRGLTEDDYALLHPAGSLGRRLLLRVSDIMRSGTDIARVPPGTSIRDAILEMTAKKVGATCVTGADGKLLGILTDHDLRRALAGDAVDIRTAKVDAFMTKSPLSARPDMLAAEAVALTEKKSVSVLPVVDSSGILAGLIHLHDLLRAGVQ
jgi:arabinose-5-phosphate isomerase